MKTGILLLGIILVIGCNQRNEELEKKTTELMRKDSVLNQELNARDEYINQVTASINDVYDNLERMKQKEKIVLKDAGEFESAKKLSSPEIRERLISQITDIDSTLRSNQKKISDLQKKVAAYKKQYAGVVAMVENLKKTLEEREQVITDLQTRISGLEEELAERNKVIRERDTEIVDKTTRLNTAYYIVGKKSELEEKGIVKNEGGFLWGLLGSTTVLTSGFDKSHFTSVDKTKDMSILVNGIINEILPKRNANYYSVSTPSSSGTTLTINDPEHFWQDKYLVIITD